MPMNHKRGNPEGYEIIRPNEGEGEKNIAEKTPVEPGLEEIHEKRKQPPLPPEQVQEIIDEISDEEETPNPDKYN
jgi:hypothetical protein